MSSQTPRVVAVIQARMGSTRLPGKVLRQLGSRTVLDWVIRAARVANGVDQVVIATSTHPGDDPVARAARDGGIEVIRGSELDVLSRFVLALEATKADAIVRLTADCPLLDPALISQTVGCWRADPNLDYAATTLIRTLPRGLDVEVVAADALRRADARATDHHRVHVTSSIYADAVAGRPTDYRVSGLVVAPAANDLRVTLDTEDDLALLRALVARLPDRPPAWREIVRELRGDSSLRGLNEHVQQKALEEG